MAGIEMERDIECEVDTNICNLETGPNDFVLITKTPAATFS